MTNDTPGKIRTAAELAAAARTIIAQALADGEAGKLDDAVYEAFKRGLALRTGGAGNGRT